MFKNPSIGEAEKALLGFVVLMLIIFLICAIMLFYVDDANAAPACGESGYGCPIVIYRQYRCPSPSNPWEECDPYIRHALNDETFCEMIVYVEGAGSPYIREVYSELCYPDTLGGEICMVLYPDVAGVWTNGKTHPIYSVYVRAVYRSKTFLPFVLK